VVVAKDYNRSLARPLFNCTSCFEKKEHHTQRSGLRVEGSGRLPTAQNPQPTAKEKE
jgi:hypothetical protein